MNANPYVQAETEIQTLRRAFQNIASALELWKHTDQKKDVRIAELNRAQDIVMVLLTSMRNDDDPYHEILHRIFRKTIADITDALLGKPIDFSEHVSSFRWMSSNLNG